MSRAAFVPCDDPFVSLLFFKLFKNVWEDEVDKLYVCYNADVDKKVADYVEKRFKESPKVVWIYVDHNIGHGEPINKCLDVCEEDLIVFVENDSYVYKKGVIDKCFARIESGECDALGSPRGCCSMELYHVSISKFGNPTLAYSGDVGPHFWPCFFFVKRKDLLRTDQNFGSKTFPKGEYIRELDWTPGAEQSGDTLVWASIQLRAMGVRFCYVPQCKIFPQHNRLEDMYPFGWVHSGSLSSGWSGRFLRGHPSPDKLSSMGDFWEQERRVAFWKMAVNLEDYAKIFEFKKAYLLGIERLIQHYGLDRNRIAEKIRGFKFGLLG